MEKPEQKRHLLRDYSVIPQSNVPLEEEAAGETGSTEDLQPRRHSFWRARPWWQYLVLLQLANILFIIVLESRGSIAHQISHARDSIVSDYWDLFNSKSSVKYKGIDEGYWTRLQNKTLWNYFLLDKHGVVALDDSHLPGFHETKIPHPTVPPLLPTDLKGKSVYQVGVFHSMHCLDMIFKQLTNPSPFTPPLNCYALQFSDYERKKFPVGLQMACHVQHCVDWIRQDVACLADPTLESLIDTTADQGARHQCRSFDTVRDWTLENQYKGDFKNLEAFG